jgi:hypothetical protein
MFKCHFSLVQALSSFPLCHYTKQEVDMLALYGARFGTCSIAPSEQTNTQINKQASDRLTPYRSRPGILEGLGSVLALQKAPVNGYRIPAIFSVNSSALVF